MLRTLETRHNCHTFDDGCTYVYTGLIHHVFIAELLNIAYFSTRYSSTIEYGYL